MKKVIMAPVVLLFLNTNAQEGKGYKPDVHLAETPAVCAPLLPYTENWENIDNFSCWSSYGEGSDQWIFCDSFTLDADLNPDNVAAIFPSQTLIKNHWLISPQLIFEAGASYKIDITYNALHSSFGPAKESLSAGILDGPDPGDSGITFLGQIHGITQNGSFTAPFNKDMASMASYTYTPQTSGAGYLSLRAGSAPQTGILLVYNVNIEAIALQTPAPESPYVVIYPNPANDKITIVSENNPVSLIEIFDANGRITGRMYYDNEPNVTYDVSGLDAGVYSVQLRCHSGSIIQKLVKM